MSFAVPLFLENSNQSEINILLRDLADSENLNVVELIKNHKLSIEEKKKSYKSKKIIEKNNFRNLQYSLKRDNERLNYYNDITIFNSKLLNEIPNFISDYGKQRMKLKLLKLAYENKEYNQITNLYLQVLSDKYANKSEEKLIKNVTKIMTGIDYKRLQFEKLSNELSPLDFYNEYEKKLDNWQLKCINYIDKGDSVVVTAPTSCGKTWLAVYPGIIGLKTLFIVPTDALVYQVSSLFTKFTNSIPTIITGDLSYNNNPNIIIGTPKSIEDKLPLIDNNFDIVVFDEIHNLNNPIFGQYYERLLKIFKNIQILCLSATIGSPDKLLNWLSDFHEKKIFHINYSTRFLNLQRQLFYNDKLIQLHPMSCLKFEDINKDFLTNNLPMTPKDCVNLYTTLSKEFPEEMKGYDVKDIFPEDNRRLSLDDSRYYENQLKLKLIKLKENYNERIINVLNRFQIDDSKNTPVNLYNLFKEIKNKNLIPCIIFQENTEYCKEIYISLVNYLEKLEHLNHPYHYDNLEFCLQEYKKSVIEIQKFKESIKLPQDTINPKDIIEEKINIKKNELNEIFINSYRKMHSKQILQIEKSDFNERIKKTQIFNLTNELKKFLKNSKLEFVDIYRKHIDFCLNYQNPMSAEKIRAIKKSISKNLNIDVAYTNIFLQGLKRGIGIYTKHMPAIYNRIVQKYAQTGELGFVIADDELALGINMPFRSAGVLGYKDSLNFKLDNYKQMIGRAGRRGKDVEGHIIYANVDWRELMKTELSEINSNYVHVKNYKILSKLSDNYDNNLDTIFNYPMNKKLLNNNTITKFYDNRLLNVLLWKFREYNQNIELFCNNILSIEQDMRIKESDESIKKIIMHICNTIFLDCKDYKETLLNLIKSKKTANSFNDFIKIKEFMRVLKEINNTLINQPETYMFLIKHIQYSFNIINKIMISSNDLN